MGKKISCRYGPGIAGNRPGSTTDGKHNGTWVYGGIMADSIIARITADRKSALAAISTTGGYSFTPDIVEEERLIFNLKGKKYFIRLVKLDASVMVEDNAVDQTKIPYLVETYVTGSDEEASDDEIVYQNRNVNADIIKAWMVDRTCGGLVDISESVGFVDGVQEDSKGNRIYCAVNGFELTARIDSNDPYLHG